MKKDEIDEKTVHFALLLSTQTLVWLESVSDARVSFALDKRQTPINNYVKLVAQKHYMWCDSSHMDSHSVILSLLVVNVINKITAWSLQHYLPTFGHKNNKSSFVHSLFFFLNLQSLLHCETTCIVNRYVFMKSYNKDTYESRFKPRKFLE